MEQKKTNKKVIIIGCIVLAILIAAAAVLFFTYRAKGMAGKKAIVFSVSADDFGADHAFNTNAEFLGDALKALGLVEGEDGPYGLYVKTVNGITADESLQQWWCFTKGGEELFIGIDSVPVADGDHFEATLKTGW